MGCMQVQGTISVSVPSDASVHISALPSPQTRLLPLCTEAPGGAPVKSSFRPTYCRVTLILLCQNDPHRKQCPMEGVRESLFTLNK